MPSASSGAGVPPGALATGTSGSSVIPFAPSMVLPKMNASPVVAPLTPGMKMPLRRKSLMSLFEKVMLPKLSP